MESCLVCGAVHCRKNPAMPTNGAGKGPVMKILNKVLPGQQYVANFMDEPLAVGKVYRMDDKQFIPALEPEDVFPGVTLNIRSGSPGNITFNKGGEIKFSFGGSATSKIGKSQVSIEFRRRRTVAGAIKDAVVDQVAFLPLKKRLKDVWNEYGFSKYNDEYIFIYQVVTAASGTLVYSHEGSNTVVLEHTMGEGVTKVLDLASGKFAFESNKKATLEIIRPIAHKPLFKAFYFKKNWEPEILGR